jgi:hypothetical protein
MTALWDGFNRSMQQMQATPSQARAVAPWFPMASLQVMHGIDGPGRLCLEWRTTIKQAPDGLFRLKEPEKKRLQRAGRIANSITPIRQNYDDTHA